MTEAEFRIIYEAGGGVVVCHRHMLKRNERVVPGSADCAPIDENRAPLPECADCASERGDRTEHCTFCGGGFCDPTDIRCVRRWGKVPT